MDGKGRIQVEATYQPAKEDIPLMPNFGMRMRMPSALNRIAWYGRGKFENYPDRKSAAFLGVYECGIHEFITNYIVCLLYTSHLQNLPPETGKQLRLIHHKRQLSVRAATTR